MPYSCRIEPEQRLGITTLRGSLTVDDFLEALRALYQHDAWRPGFDALWDGRGVRELVLGEEDVAAIVGRVRQLTDRMGSGRAAFVVPREIDHLIAQLILHLTETERRQRKTFQSMPAALVWLGRADRGSSEQRSSHSATG